jgi:flagellar hook assembly protein FlgD
LVVLGGGGAGAYFGFFKDKPEKEKVEKVEKKDATPAKTAETKAATPKPKNYAWTGAWRNGKAHGTGTYTYKVETLIDSRDPQKRVAQVGDYIIGEYYEGRLVQGRWYDQYNNVKGSIIIGR